MLKLVCFIANLALIPWSAWVLTKLWAWFLVPLGVPGVGLWHAAGLALLFGFLRSSSRHAKEFEAYTDIDRVSAVLHEVFVPAAALGLGAIFHAWM